VGSLLGLGPRARSQTFTVTCNATDPSGNRATSLSFTVTVLGVDDQLRELGQTVARAAEVPAMRKKSLASDLTLAKRNFDAGRVTAAQARLASFIKSAQALPGLEGAQTQWIRAAARIIAVMG
jgi:hypothetical protein